MYHPKGRGPAGVAEGGSSGFDSKHHLVSEAPARDVLGGCPQTRRVHAAMVVRRRNRDAYRLRIVIVVVLVVVAVVVAVVAVVVHVAFHAARALIRRLHLGAVVVVRAHGLLRRGVGGDGGGCGDGGGDLLLLVVVAVVAVVVVVVVVVVVRRLRFIISLLVTLLSIVVRVVRGTASVMMVVALVMLLTFDVFVGVMVVVVVVVSAVRVLPLLGSVVGSAAPAGAGAGVGLGQVARADVFGVVIRIVLIVTALVHGGAGPLAVRPARREGVAAAARRLRRRRFLPRRRRRRGLVGLLARARLGFVRLHGGEARDGGVYRRTGVRR
mmetsp:Transcript_35507/g.87273  ORF Transcript_35507/g.87273 Transcript_35507/m.87273 type:complete len:325 (-) Transcript_35507:553-1527(-)